MAKDDQVKAIQAANGIELNEADYSAKQLGELQKLAEEGKAENLEAFNAKKQEFDSARAAANPAPASAKQSGEKKITVKVNAAIAAMDGEFTDPDSKATIGKKAVSVPHTAFVKEKIRSDELVEVE